MNRRIRPLILAVFGAFLAGMGLADAQDIVSKPPPWDRELVKLASTLPVQEDGRIKPLSTYADFALLRLNGKREVYNLDEKRISSTEWLLDCLFYPEAARRYKSFLVEASEVLDAIGVAHEKKRDRYSYAQLEPGIPKLFQLASQYSTKEAKDRGIVENQIVILAHNVNEFELLSHYLDFARHSYFEGQSERLKQLVPVEDGAAFSAILMKLPTLRQLYLTLSTPQEGVDQQTLAQEQKQVEQFMTTLGHVADLSTALALFPPADPKTPEWLSPADIAQLSLVTPEEAQPQVAKLAELEKLTALRDQPDTFKSQFAAFQQQIMDAAKARGEYSKVPLEYFYYKGDRRGFMLTSVLFVVFAGLVLYRLFRPEARWATVAATVALTVPMLFQGYLFYNALTLYLLSFLVVALLWVRPKSRILGILAPITIAAPTILVLVGITLRCIIRSRPPVSTLYETVLFVTASVVIVALAIEWMNRRKLALSLASMLGVLGLFLANKYEMSEGVDTMPSLVAVLDTNFWLATHVTTVTLGYAAGLLAAAIAHVYIFGKLFRVKPADPAFYSSVTNMTYGVLCFGLFFSVLGTVLGGIWANDSWGRFWGWDPKENGALMIVLWELAILHALAGRYIRELGLAIACVFGAIVVAFSWWGVNLLGVGLHSYGFTSGAAQSLAIFYSVESVVILAGFVVWLRDRFRPAAEEVEPEPAPVLTGKQRTRPAKG
ncbi:MAG: cytochrome c biogenesis protein CcsA [FCB group bacterium]|jgi:ABC-type transport system involved in cytochrome c biogenesis permease subunit|nr:cytochrome c biogenesis protein CcsA [FCB group bacterium]